MNKKTLITITLLFFSIANYAANLWHISLEKEIAMPGEQKLFPNHYLLAKLDVNELQLFQSQIPVGSQENYPIIDLPKPNGEMATYYIFETKMLAADLEAQFPAIKTYTLIDTENPLITGKADVTFWGFHAKVFDGANTYFIDPYRQGNQDWYLVFYKKDYTKPANKSMECLVEDEADNIAEINNGQQIKNNIPQLKGQQKTFGTEIRKYRLALACTEEYAAAVGGATPTTNSVLAAMVTTMNRVNGVFEREFSMYTELVNNTSIIFLPGSNDPYTNSSGSTMLAQNSTTLNANVGASNFDIGHVFSTGGGGIAILGSVCRTSKARGVTGNSNPVGDPFDIDFVAHEMGHQFGGSHTFNSTIGSCGGNGSSSSSFEPGSGTTIMAYAGICGSDNIQGNSDDYYHTRSLIQMSAHMEGNGNCAVNIPSNNTPPNLSNINVKYNIPYKTFFELTASATDADNDPITYCWEQWDLGAYGPWSDVSAGNPLFRSIAPSPSNVRTFPIFSKIFIEDIKYRGEVLPEVDRFVNFKVAARDIKNGYGSFNNSDDELELHAYNTGTSLYRVTSHDVQGQTWTGDKTQTVTWNTAGTENAPINTPTVDIFISLDAGATWPHLMASNVPNDGSQVILAPNFNSKFALVKVKGHNNVFFDVNNKYIEIIQQVYPASTKNRALQNISIYPNPTTNKLFIDNLPANVQRIMLVSTTGQIVKDFALSNELNIAEVARGLYFLKIVDEQNNTNTQKIIIE